MSPRPEDHDLLTGRARFGGDLRADGDLFAAFVRSTEPHARIEGITVPDDLAPGVRVFTAAELGLRPDTPLPELIPWSAVPQPLATEIVHHVGDPVAVVVAPSEAEAVDATEQVVVAYHPLPVQRSTLAEITDGHFTGDASVIGRYHYPRVAACPIEPLTGLAEPDGEGGVVIHWSTQMPAGAHDTAASTLGLPDDRVRVVAPWVGGGFGGKTSGTGFEMVVAAKLAMVLDRPIRVVQGRAETLLGMQARDQRQVVELAATADGRVEGVRVTVEADCGGYGGTGVFEPQQTARLLPGPYRIDAVEVTARSMRTNRPPTHPYRGPGRSEAIYAMERSMDLLAHELGIDAAELRRRNLLRSEDFPRSTAGGMLLDEADHLGCLERALEVVGYDDLRTRQAAGTPIGVGLCCWVDFTGRYQPCQPAVVGIGPDGRIVVDTGTPPVGTGVQGVVARIVAATLGLPTESIVTPDPDTGRLRPSLGAYGSRSAQLAGSSALDAARRLRERIADRLEAAPEDLVFGPDRTVGVAGVPASSRSLVDLAGLVVESAFDQGQPTHPAGTQVAVVELDPETGRITPLRHVAVTDCGTVLDHELAGGQVQGGSVQGIAIGLFEEMVYAADETPLTTTLAEYLVPSAADVPSVECHFIETPTDRNPLGAKGVAESGVIGAAPAVANAVLDALRPYGVAHLDMPLTPEKVWAAIAAAPA